MLYKLLWLVMRLESLFPVICIAPQLWKRRLLEDTSCIKFCAWAVNAEAESGFLVF